MIEAQHSAESLAASHCSGCPGRSAIQLDQLVVETLVVPLPVVVLGELMERPVQRVLAEEDHAIQALFLDGANEPLGVGIAVGRPHRALNGLNPGVGKDALEVTAELRVPVMDEKASRGGNRRTRPSDSVRLDS